MVYQRDEGAPLAAGSLLRKRYRIESVLGRGENGVTYAAADTLSGGAVAIKEFFPERLCMRAEGTSTLSPRNRESGTQFFLGSEAFLSQHDALTQAAGSASVVSVYEVFFENGTSYAVMERLRGVTLSEYAARVKRRLRPGEAVTLLMALSGALLVVHSLNMLHGSIVPENVFITEDDAVKLIDFGAARETLKLHRAVDNEQVQTDIRALGRMVCTLLTGRPAPADPAPLYAQMPSALASVLERMLTNDGKLRFESVFALMHALNCMDISPQPLAIPAPRPAASAPLTYEVYADMPAPARNMKARKRARLMLLVGGVILALLLILIITLATRG